MGMASLTDRGPHRGTISCLEVAWVGEVLTVGV
jgi:hypothetical protein